MLRPRQNAKSTEYHSDIQCFKPMAGALAANQRPHAHQARTLTNCATPRIIKEGLLIRSICSRIASAKVVRNSAYCKQIHKN